jgi:hypothetical protein
MKRFLAVVLATLVCALCVHAGDMKVEVMLAKDKDSKPTNTFEPNVPNVCAFFKTKDSTKGDKLRAVWLAEDVGDAAPKNTKIDEATMTADQDDFYGAFSLSKPTEGWPEGAYRVDIYNGDEVAVSAKFTIKKGTKSEDSDESNDSEESDKDSSDD